MSYTKGDWKVEGNLVTVHDGMPACEICSVQIYRNEHEANANLISAAPDMYEALFIGLDLVLQILYEHPNDEVAQAQKIVIEKALAKAEGK